VGSWGGGKKDFGCQAVFFDKEVGKKRSYDVLSKTPGKKNERGGCQAAIMLLKKRVQQEGGGFLG